MASPDGTTTPDTVTEELLNELAKRKRLEEEKFTHLKHCLQDAYEAEKLEPEVLSVPNDWRGLLTQLNQARVTLPSEHRNGAAAPFRETLSQMGPAAFAEIWSTHPQDDPTCNGFLMRDIAQALLQRVPVSAEHTADPSTKEAREEARERRQATDAFQEVVFDLYDTFLNPRWRRSRPNFSLLPPLVTWVRQNSVAPYTWDTSATLPFFGVECGVVTLPSGNAKKGLLSWAAIAHECSGHDVLSADAGLGAEIEEKLKEAVGELNRDLQPLGEYWLQRWHEAAADVMAILNMGPAAGLALLGYFQARRRARGEKPILSCVDKDPDSTHPIDIMRAALWVAVIEQLPTVQVKSLPGFDRQSWNEMDEEQRGNAYPQYKALRERLAPWAAKIEELAKADLEVVLNDHDPERDPKVKPGKPVDRKAIIKLKQSHAAHACFFSWNQAKQTAAVLLKVLNKPLVCLDQARLRDFCDWTLKDEMAVEELCVFLTYPDYDDRIKEVIKLRAEYRYEQGYGPNADRPRLDTLKRQLNGLWPRSPKDNATDGRWDLDGLWAAHVVAAAITVALRKDKGLSVPVAFERMKKLLALMHNYNRRWGLAQELSLSEYEET